MNASRLGWIISGVIVLIVAGAFCILLLPAGIRAPTADTTAPGVLDVITLTADPAQMVDMPTGGSGAEADYADMIATAIGKGDWHDLPDFKEKVDNTPEPQDDPAFKKILDYLQTAAGKPIAGGDLIFDKLKITPLSDFNSRDIFYGIAKMGGKAALNFKASGDKQKARKIYESVFIFGYRLWQFGPYRAYRIGGLDAMSEAGTGLSSLLDELHDPKAALAKEITQAIDVAARKWMTKEHDTIRTTKPEPGDMANLALNDKDRAWRIEGVMELGVAKWTNAGDKERLAIDKFLDAQSHTSDKVYAESAAQARDFTAVDIRQIPP